ncbi:MAG: potassium transporter KtrB [Spirochaetia bacterium]|nr:potassium transporter KtrB [Spirochaetia bacterium]
MHPKFRIKSATENLFIYFLFLALTGTILFRFPAFYSDGMPIPLIDSIFTTVSAMCVTGLSTVDMSVFSNSGFLLILLLIEAGGLGLVSFFTIYLALDAKKISLLNRNIIKDYFTEEQQIETKQIIREIISFTLFILFLGALILSLLLKFHGEKNYIFYGIFISVSAFCNAGFSPYSESLSSFTNSPVFLLTVSLIIILGGLGFSVMSNIFFTLKKQNGKKRTILSLHSKIVLFTTFILIAGGTAFFFIFEYNGAYKDLSFSSALLNAFFQAVTLRTAGFETVSQNSFSAHSTVLSDIFMLIGGSPGSMAGGIKTTTFFLLLTLAYKSIHDKNSPSIFHRDISESSTSKATSIFIKAICFLSVMIILLLISEQKSIKNGIFSESSLIFEAFSAFATVGLSKGITGLLSNSGKIIIIFLMFAGRTGITFIALNNFSRKNNIKSLSDYPEEDVLLG